LTCALPIFTDNDSNADTRTFEELCRAHIKAFARGAEKYASETKLSARVGQWQDKLMPLLDEEEHRPAFDIHEYGNAVIQSMEKQISRRLSKGGAPEDAIKDSSTRIVDFRDVTRDCPPYEVCRMFLAALSLNNSGNIQFTESSLESLKAELVSSEIERPMETYLAPSVEEAF
jgi:condensin-2 complex subunit H2